MNAWRIFAVAVGRTLHPEGTALFVEPGTRLGGTLTAKLRETALEEGLKRLWLLVRILVRVRCWGAPRERRRRRRVRRLAVAPAWLADFWPGYAKLPKDSLSLSFMQLRPESEAAPIAQKQLFLAMDPNGVVARILSESFPSPRHGTCPLCLYGRRVRHYPRSRGHPLRGACRRPRRPASPRKDAKTGAVELLWQPEQKPQR